MEKQYVYKTKGTCSRQMNITYDGDILVNLEVIGGCNGNLKGISALVKGKHFSEIVSCLEGIHCGPRPTSCPDQLAKAIKEICVQENISL